jgi:hypothetical protein
LTFSGLHIIKQQIKSNINTRSESVDTVFMQEILDKAFEAGRAAERKMAELYTAQSAYNMLSSAAVATTPTTVPSGNGPSKRPGRVAKHVETVTFDPPLKPAKTIVVAHGVKKAGAPRTKGVKIAIMSLIGESNGVTTAHIVATLGFKAASVNSTLAGLKKAGLASQEGKFWFLTASPNQGGGNSETEAHVDA